MNNSKDNKISLSVAWADAFLHLMSCGCEKLAPLIVSISDLDNHTIVEDTEIRDALDGHLQRLDESSCDTVANTIFPRTLWNPARERKLLYKRYMESAWPRLKKCHANNHGTYFQRMIAWKKGDGSVNQLEHVVQTWREHQNHRHSALQIAIFDPTQDHVHSRQRGFPCLHQVCFTPIGPNGMDGLNVTGFYATQNIFEKAYGNYLGLCRLGQFMAHALDLHLTKVTCIAAIGKTEARKSDLTPLEQAIKCIREKHSTTRG